jgi:DNA-directed RNA polymerase subunit H (RpoH/RPB5)
MWKNTVAIHNILKEKKLQNEIFNQLNIKKVQLTKIILEKKKQKKRESTIGKKNESNTL